MKVLVLIPIIISFVMAGYKTDSLVVTKSFNIKNKQIFVGSGSIANAINSLSGGGTIILTDTTYSIAATIYLPSNITIDGNNAKIISKIIPSSTGEKTLKIFQNKNVADSNITIKNLIISGGWNGVRNRISVTDTSYISNMVRFKNVKNLTLENVNFQSHTSNYFVDPLGNPDSDNLFATTAIVACTTVVMNDCKLNNYDVEGIFYYDCDKVKIVSLNTDSRNSGWTPLHLWYTSNILVKNCKLKNSNASGGSSINSCANNMEISNCEIDSAKGIDLSNELNKKQYPQHTISIYDNTLNVKQYGIQRPPYDSNGTLYNLEIRNNKIKVDSTSSCRGIRLNAVKTVSIFKNEITVVDTVKSSSAAITLIEAENVTMEKNTINATRGLFMYLGDSLNLKNIKFIYNDGIISPKWGTSVTNGFSSVCYIRANLSTTGPSTLDGFDFSHNTFSGVEGAIIRTLLLDTIYTHYLNNVKINFNNIYSTKNRIIYGMAINNANGLQIMNNYFQDCAQNTIDSCTDIIITDNTIRFVDTTQKADQWLVNQGMGFGKFEGNVVLNGDGSYQTFKNTVANNFTDFITKDNYPDTYDGFRRKEFTGGDKYIGADTGSLYIGKSTSGGSIQGIYVRGFPVMSSGTPRGSYGDIELNSNSNLTSAARPVRITNAYLGNRFAVTLGSNATTPPVYGNGGSDSVGLTPWSIDNTGKTYMNSAKTSDTLQIGTNGSKLREFRILSADSTMYALVGADTFFIKMSKK